MLKLYKTHTCSAWAARRERCTHAEAARVVVVVASDDKPADNDDEDEEADNAPSDATPRPADAVDISASGIGATGVRCSVATPALRPAAQHAACSLALAARHTLRRRRAVQ